ncbi:MAG: hypothetical protein KJT03_20400, partial [Verrucomicrobiae bacterium]|nr:hypothetical protein [Verrucomicrobiae bacterium]
MESSYTKVSEFTIGAGDSTVGYVASVDKFNNWYHTYTEANRSNAKIVQKTYVDDTGTDLLLSETTSINGLEVDSVNAEGHVFSKSYDSLGRLELDVDSRTDMTDDIFTEYAYKSNGQLDYMKESFDTNGLTTSYVYGTSSGYNKGKVIAVLNDDSKATRYNYDAMGRVTHVWGDVPQPVKYTYNDPFGRKTRMDTYRSGTFTSSSLPSGFSSAGDKTEWVYDNSSGWLLEKKDNADKKTEFEYTAAGQLAWKKNPRGFWINYQYYNPSSPGSDAIPGALHKVVYPSPFNSTASDQYTPDLEFTYERHGGYKEVKEGNTFNKRKFTYDSNFEVTQEDLASSTSGDFYHSTNDVINYTYDTTQGFVGRLKTFNYKNATTYENEYTYDSTGRIAQITNDPSIGTAFDYTYLSDANVVESVSHGDYSMDVVYRTDSYRQDTLITTWDNDPDPDSVQEYRYTYDGLGRREYEKSKGVVPETLRSTYDQWAAKTLYNDRNEVTSYRLYQMDGSWNPLTSYSIYGTYQT